MIKIHSIDEEGIVTERLWDNVSCDFFTADGELIGIDLDISAAENNGSGCDDYNTCCTSGDVDEQVLKKAYESMSERARFKKTTLTKDKNILSLRVQMGMKCNYKCQYCKQAVHGCYDPHADLHDAEDFIAGFDQICTTDRNEPINIQLWGGEPLLYWPTLKLLGEFFRKEFPYARITCLSNGSLIDQEKADWFLAQNIILAVSHDGPGQLDYRTGDCLADGSETLKWLKYYAEKCEEPLYFNAVITKNRYDLVGVINHIKARIGKKARVGFEGIVLVEDESQFDESTMFTDADYHEMRHAIAEQLVSGGLSEVGMFQSKINTLMNVITTDNFRIADDQQQKCSMDSPYNLSVDLKGNILACHSTPKTIGHIKQFAEASLEKINFVHWHQRDECRKCAVLALCKGGCLAQDATAFFHSCNNEFYFNLIFFDVVFRLLFGETIIAIDGIERPTRDDFIKRYSTGS